MVGGGGGEGSGGWEALGQPAVAAARLGFGAEGLLWRQRRTPSSAAGIKHTPLLTEGAQRRGAEAYGAKGCGVELRGRKREAGAGGQAGLAVGPGPGPGREGPRDRRESRLRVGWTRRAEGTRRRGVRVWFGSGVGP